MNNGEISIKFQPQGKTVLLPAGSTMREAAARAGILLDYPCGGQGTCGKCRVRFMADAPQPTDAERGVLDPAVVADGVRLACQCRVETSATVEVPETSLLASSYQILGSGSTAAQSTADPPVWKRYVELPPPTLGDDAPDLQRLEAVLGPIRADLAALQVLPQRLRACGWRGTAVLVEGRLVDFEAGNTENECHAVAFDVGTTTLVGVLINLVTGEEKAVTSRINPQTSYGDDVLSRILFARESKENLRRIQAEVLNAIRAMIAELAEKADVPVDRIYEATFAGNTTMESLLTGIDPAPLGESPFVPAWRDGLTIPASELDLGIHPHGQAYVFPVIGGFVGGDTVAGMVATDIAKDGGPILLIDIGTNGEIVLHHEGELLAASCAAGPAFEGARISQGMRAASGAIEKVSIDSDVHLATIGGAPAVGLCGSALIDVAAELLRTGIVMSQGMMLPASAFGDELSASLKARIVDREDGPAFVIATPDMTQTGAPVQLLQQDVRELQLATAAIRAGIAIVLRKAGLDVNELKTVLVAGAFGNYIRCANAQRIGLLPHAVDESRIFFVGNTSLTGAILAARSRHARRKAEELARETAHVDLSQDPNFQNEYVEAMFFPESE